MGDYHDELRSSHRGYLTIILGLFLVVIVLLILIRNRTDKYDYLAMEVQTFCEHTDGKHETGYWYDKWSLLCEGRGKK